MAGLRFVLAMAAALVPTALAHAAPPVKAKCPLSTSLEGKFMANDQGTYWLRSNGSTVWWLGKSADNGQSWTNVFRGTRKGNLVAGQWLDIGDGATAQGTMVLRVTANNQLEKVSANGDGFGGAIWLRPGCTYSKATAID